MYRCCKIRRTHQFREAAILKIYFILFYLKSPSKHSITQKIKLVFLLIFPAYIIVPALTRPCSHRLVGADVCADSEFEKWVNGLYAFTNHFWKLNVYWECWQHPSRCVVVALHIRSCNKSKRWRNLYFFVVVVERLEYHRKYEQCKVWICYIYSFIQAMEIKMLILILFSNERKIN